MVDLENLTGQWSDWRIKESWLLQGLPQWEEQQYNNKRSLFLYIAINDITHCHQNSPKDRWQMESLHSWVCLEGHLLAGQTQNSSIDRNWNPRPPQVAILDTEGQRIHFSLSWGGFSWTKVRFGKQTEPKLRAESKSHNRPVYLPVDPKKLIKVKD